MALADLEKKERLLGIVTQNFDGLHHDAGNNPKHIVKYTVHHARRPVQTVVNAHRYRNFNNASMLEKSIPYVQIVEDF